LLEQLQKVRPDIKGKPVNKREDHPDILQRWDQYKVERPKQGTGQTATYSASIEAKRLTFVQQALEYFEEEEKRERSRA
jgi:hypothetical protein